MIYQIIAHPRGERTVVATLHGVRERYEDMLTVALMVGTGKQDVGSELVAIAEHARTQAKLRGEYVDVLRDGKLIVTMSADGPA